LNVSTLENETCTLTHSETIHPVRRHLIPEEQRPQPYRYESPETRKLIVARPLGNSGAILENEGSLSGSSEPATKPNPLQDFFFFGVAVNQLRRQWSRKPVPVARARGARGTIVLKICNNSTGWLGMRSVAVVGLVVILRLIYAL
jgi:hypothetical protein